ncbi:MAG: aminoglycoside phosphotransferase family protein, partial [Planktomarina sp.]
MSRNNQIIEFLNNAGCGGCQIRPLAGDASNRKYWRLTLPDGRPAVLMDAPSESGEDIRPFLNIGQHLTNCGLAAPETYAQDPTHGFILMQDFGDGLFFDLVKSDPTQEFALYSAALDALDHLHACAAPTNVTDYGVDAMSTAAGLAAQWYGETVDQNVLPQATHDALSKLDWSSRVLVLRDYHAQNLIWCPDQHGLARVGLLDFQDAQVGHPLYDAASLLNDARRDVAPDVKSALKSRLRAQFTNFDSVFSTISAQRNLRILGVFARLCIRDGKVGYV